MSDADDLVAGEQGQTLDGCMRPDQKIRQPHDFPPTRTALPQKPLTSRNAASLGMDRWSKPLDASADSNSSMRSNLTDISAYTTALITSGPA